VTETELAKYKKLVVSFGKQRRKEKRDFIKGTTEASRWGGPRTSVKAKNKGDSTKRGKGKRSGSADPSIGGQSFKICITKKRGTTHNQKRKGRGSSREEDRGGGRAEQERHVLNSWWRRSSRQERGKKSIEVRKQTPWTDQDSYYCGRWGNKQEKERDGVRNDRRGVTIWITDEGSKDGKEYGGNLNKWKSLEFLCQTREPGGGGKSFVKGVGGKRGVYGVLYGDNTLHTNWVNVWTWKKISTDNGGGNFIQNHLDRTVFRTTGKEKRKAERGTSNFGSSTDRGTPQVRVSK